MDHSRQISPRCPRYRSSGKVRLSMKVVDQQTGQDLESKQKVEGEQTREVAAGGAAE